MVGIQHSLTFDAAVPIEMTSTAALGGNSDLVGTRGVGAGLGCPVAMTAAELRGFLSLPQKNLPQKNSKQEAGSHIIHAPNTKNFATAGTSNQFIRDTLLNKGHQGTHLCSSIFDLHAKIIELFFFRECDRGSSARCALDD